MQKKSKNIAKLTTSPHLIPLISISLFLIVWEAGVRMFSIPLWFLPGPVQILVALWQSKDLLWHHALVTVMEAIIGLGLAVIAGIGIAVMMEWSPVIRRVVSPFLVLSQTIPFITLAPLLTIWLGFGLLPKIILIALVCFFPITINLLEGFASVERSIIRMLLSMGADKRQVFKFLTLPASLPFFFSGFRIAGTYALLTAVVSEWIGASRGLGIYLTRVSKSFLTDRVFATVILITLLSLLTVWAIDCLARLLMPWREYKNG